MAFPADQLLAARKRLGLSQLAFAVEVGSGQATYRSWESQGVQPTPYSWYRVAAYLHRRGIDFPGPDLSRSYPMPVPGSANPATAGPAAVARPTPAGEPPALPAVPAVPVTCHLSPVTWPGWRAAVKSNGGRWHHRPLERGVTVGLLWNAPFAWELTIEAFRGIVSEEIADRALSLLYGADGIRLYYEDPDTHEFIRDPRVRIVQATPHLVRMRVRTPECSLRWSEIENIDPTSLLALSGLREAIS